MKNETDKTKEEEWVRPIMTHEEYDRRFTWLAEWGITTWEDFYRLRDWACAKES